MRGSIGTSCVGGCCCRGKAASRFGLCGVNPDDGKSPGACRHGHARTPLRGDHDRIRQAGDAKHRPDENTARARLADALRTDARAFRRIDIAVRDPALPEGGGFQGVLPDEPVERRRMNIEGSCNFAGRVSVINSPATGSPSNYCAQILGMRPPVRPGASRSPSGRSKAGRFPCGMW